MLSMTGYGEGRAETDELKVVVIIRTVNHRFLDLALRLPDAYRPVELELAALIKKRLGRGRVEVRYRVDTPGAPPVNVHIRREVVARYLEEIGKIATLDGIEGGAPDTAELLRLPEVVAVEAREETVGETERRLLQEATDAALEEVVASRGREGAQLEVVLLGHLEGLEAVRADLAEAAPAALRTLSEGLQSRLEELLGERGLDAERLAQEAAVLAERADVREELDRLSAHLETFRELTRGDGPVGKRMDFLGQEILRELNTLGSKCRSLPLLERVVDGKVHCEQLREQIQNLE